MDVFRCECGKQFSWAKGVDLCKAGNHGGLKHNLKADKEPVADVLCNVGLSLLPLDEDKLKTVIMEILKEEQWEGGTLIEYEAMAVAIRKFHKWLCEQTEAKR